MTWGEVKHYAIGIDAGTNTGVAIYDIKNRKLIQCYTMKIHRAMELVKTYREHKLIVVVEDARKAVFWKAKDYAKAQGAGSIKRDAVIWQDFLSDIGIEYRMQRPSKSITKLGKYEFQKITGYAGLTSSHSRDAAMMVYELIK